MKLSRMALAKIYLAFHPTWIDSSHSKLSQSDDSGVLYLQHPQCFPNQTVFIFFAAGKGAPLEKINDFHPRYCSHHHYLVLPYDMVSPSIIERLERLETLMYERDGDGARICIVADVGIDSITGSMKYSYRGFDDVQQLEELIYKEMDVQETPAGSFRTPVVKMSAILKNELAKGYPGITLHQVDEILQDVRKNPFPEHFEELVGDGRGKVIDSIVDLVLNGLNIDEAKSQTIDRFCIADCDILHNFITDIVRKKENQEKVDKEKLKLMLIHGNN